MMNSDNRDDEIAQILDARAGHSALASGAASVEGRPDLRGLAEAADLAWSSVQGAPPLADDPVAAMLGLVPDPEIELDGKALATARKRAGLTVSDLALRLTARGWEITSKEIFAWENGRNVPKVPALINALAHEVRADPDRLRTRSGEDPERARLAAVIASAAFKGLAERWARLQGTTIALASSALESRMLVAVHRGGAPDTEVLLDSLEAMVSAVEDPGGQ
jgi:transcriptional regulator with XRE-family HTH domain